MKKIIFLMLISCVLLTACNEDTKNGQVLNDKNIERTGNDCLALDENEFMSILVKDFELDHGIKYNDTAFINEFCSFLSAQDYEKTDREGDLSHEVLVYGIDGQEILKINFGGSIISFDRDIRIGDDLVEKGDYDVYQRYDSFLRLLYKGTVLDPEHILLPASLKIPDGISSVRMANGENANTNQYETFPALYGFIQDCFSNNEFEIVNSRKIHNYEMMKDEKSKAVKSGKSITISFLDDLNIEIDSMNEYRELYGMGEAVLCKEPEGDNLYKLYANKIIFDIRVDREFDLKFTALFDNDRASNKDITPEDIENLFNKKGEYLMEHISRNLGIDEWNREGPDSLEKKELKLNEDDPYTILELRGPYDLRILIFKQNADKTWKFIDFIDFGGKVAGTEYSLEKLGDKTFVVGNICRGYGTGVATYNREWYLVSDEGRKLVLSFPYEEWMVGPYGGYRISLRDKEIISKDGAKMSLSFTISKIYNLDLDIADEYGQIELPEEKEVEFLWDDAEQVFVSEYPVDESGVTQISIESPGLSKNCDLILEKYYDRLLENIEKIGKEEAGDEWKREAVKAFLDDCSDSEKKAELLRRLNH